MNGEAYVKVYAASANTYDVGNPSGDKETTSAHVSWTSSGFTGVDWYTGLYPIANIHGEYITVWGPLHNFSPEQIADAISTPLENPNLNDEFQAWESSVDIDIRSGWIQYVAHYTALAGADCVA